MPEMSVYNPYNWYWLADDGRLYSSAVTALIDPSDPDYVSWSGLNVATRWPPDDAGNQTDWSLQAVLAPYGLAVDLKAYARISRDTVEVSGCPITGIAGMTTIATDTNSQALMARYNELANDDSKFVVAWVMPDRSTVSLTNANIKAIYIQEMAFYEANYNNYSGVISGIDGGTITTKDEIDQAFGLTKQVARVALGWNG
jgi:hypothetical protein